MKRRKKGSRNTMVFKKRNIDDEYKLFRKTVLQRDHYTCQMPYCESKRSLVVHHIKPYSQNISLRTDPENGITLCRKCHKQTFGKESKYSHIFLSIIYSNGVNNDSTKGRN